MRIDQAYVRRVIDFYESIEREHYGRPTNSEYTAENTSD